MKFYTAEQNAELVKIDSDFPVLKSRERVAAIRAFAKRNNRSVSSVAQAIMDRRTGKFKGCLINSVVQKFPKAKLTSSEIVLDIAGLRVEGTKLIITLAK